MGTQAVNIAPLSKFAFSDLVLDTALELEKARAGTQVNLEPVHRLANALSRASRPFATTENSAFVEPLFYDSFERLFRVQRANSPESVEQIQAFVGDAVDGLRSVEENSPTPESISKLVSFCVELHRELAREIEAEEGRVVDEWRTSDIAAEDRFC